MSGPLLAWDAGCLPGESFGERLALAARLDLALEVENRGGLDPEPYRRSGLRVVTVQAWLFHEAHPIHRDRAKRAEAAKHLAETLEMADRLGARRALAITGYGTEIADRPFERALDFLSGFSRRARELGVRIVVEPLSPKRVAVLHDPEEVARLVDELDDPGVFGMLLDLGHLADSGFDPASFLRDWKHPVEEIHLKGAGSKPPDPSWPLGEWLAPLPALPEILCGEHREPIAEGALREVVAEIRRLF